MSAALADLNALSLEELYHRLASDGSVRRLLELARDEDLGPVGGVSGDITTSAWGGSGRLARSRLMSRSTGVVSGLATTPLLLELFAPACRVTFHAADGESIVRGEALAEITGPMDEMLALERTLLNVVGRLSGVATQTHRFVEAMAREAPGARARVCDTRKTTPGMRSLEKYAVRCGGGWLHRLGLYDAVLLKDNHLAGVGLSELAERVREASARARAGRVIRFVEVEVDSLAQLEALLRLPAGVVDSILLDNMNPPTLREAVRMRDGAGSEVLLEASGGVSLETIGAIARAGVDRISVGALTHSAPALDVGLDML